MKFQGALFRIKADDQRLRGGLVGRLFGKTAAAVLMGLSVTVLSVQASEPDASELRSLVLQDCGSCHGLQLRGGLGPPLRPEDLERLSVEAIAAIIRHGTPDTAMPPWKDLLNDHEIRWISEKLQSGALLNSNDPR